MRHIKLIIVGVVVLILFVGLVYSSYQFQRWINYSFGYQNRVVVTICETVKHEHLTDPSVCQ